MAINRVSLVLFLLFPMLLMAQTRSIDSLENLLRNKKLVTKERIFLYNELADELSNLASIKTLYYATKAINEAILIKDNQSQARALNSMGSYYEVVELYDSSVYVLKKARLLLPFEDKKLDALIETNIGLAYYRLGISDSAFSYLERARLMHTNLKDTAKLLNVLNNIAILNCINGNYSKGQQYFLQCLKFHEKRGDKILVALDYNNLGLVMENQNMFKQASLYFEKALAIGLQLQDTGTIFRAYINLALVAEEGRKDYDLAIKYDLLALKFTQPSKKSMRSTIEHNLSSCYLQKDDYKTALNYLQSALKVKEELGENTAICDLLINLSSIRKSLGQYSEAIAAAKRAEKVAEEAGGLESKLKLKELLTDSYLEIGDVKNAKLAYEIYKVLKDSLYNENHAANVAEIQTKFETEKKENENKILQQDNLLKQSKIDERNKTIIVLVIGILLIVFIVIWRINIINLKKKQKELEATQAMQKEKERISRDLHDNVGGQLSYVLYSLDGINTDDKSKRIEIACNVNESVRNVISNLRETIWAINDEAISINDFSDKLKVYVRAMFRNTETKISFTENIQIDKKLNSLVGLNLYRICQEIINNAFKHSKAKELIVNITSDSHVIIEIKDNGVGFDVEAVSKEGFGLANIKSRAAEVGITLELESKRNDGVKYKLLV